MKKNRKFKKPIDTNPDAVFNIVRKQKGVVTITHRELSKKDAMPIFNNLRARARDAHSNVFFDLVEVPYELTAKGKAEAAAKRDAAEARAHMEAKLVACVAANHPLDNEGWCEECMHFTKQPEQAAA